MERIRLCLGRPRRLLECRADIHLQRLNLLLAKSAVALPLGVFLPNKVRISLTLEHASETQKKPVRALSE